MSRRSAFWVLAVAGALAGHALGYATGGAGTGAHGYLDWVMTLVVPALAVALAASAVRLTRDSAATVRPGALALAQITIVVLQETAEGAVHGLSPLAVLDLPVVRWAVLFQFVVAATLVLTVRLGASAVRAIQARRVLRPTVPAVLIPGVAAVRCPGHDVPTVLLRGPPTRVFA